MKCNLKTEKGVSGTNPFLEHRRSSRLANQAPQTAALRQTPWLSVHPRLHNRWRKYSSVTPVGSPPNPKHITQGPTNVGHLCDGDRGACVRACAPRTGRSQQGWCASRACTCSHRRHAHGRIGSRHLCRQAHSHDAR